MEIITEKQIKERNKQGEQKQGQDRIQEQREKDEIKKKTRIEFHENEFTKLMELVRVEKGGKISCQRKGCDNNKGVKIFFVEDSAYGGILRCTACGTMIDSEDKKKIKERYPIFSAS